jgi:predicted RNA binding protein YcfA (HicA-like mRNA interferase family)
VTTKFPIDVPVENVIRALESLGFRVVRTGNHLALLRENEDGTRTPITIPNHPEIKGSTLPTILTQAGIRRDEFLKAFEVL